MITHEEELEIFKEYMWVKKTLSIYTLKSKEKYITDHIARVIHKILYRKGYTLNQCKLYSKMYASQYYEKWK